MECKDLLNIFYNESFVAKLTWFSCHPYAIVFINIGNIVWAALGILWGILAVIGIARWFIETFCKTKLKVDASIKPYSTIDKVIFKAKSDEAVKVTIARAICDFQLRYFFKPLNRRVKSFKLSTHWFEIRPDIVAQETFAGAGKELLYSEMHNQLKSEFGWLIPFLRASIKTQDNKEINIDIREILKPS